MFVFLQTNFNRYVRLRSVDVTDAHDLEEKSRAEETRWSTIAILLYSFAFTLLLLVAWIFVQMHAQHTSIESSSCHDPPMRQEWRTLSMEEQLDYIKSSQCLQSIPSRLHNGMSIYDDFPFLHDVVGDYAHETAAFLTWHRYFIHLYESNLRELCNYEGALPYWDWSLDWKQLSNSPVFHKFLGFGGNNHLIGHASVEPTVGGDRCVEDGPWAGLLVHWWTQHSPPHCLSRGFQDVTPIDEMGHYLDGDAIDRLLQQKDFESFFMMMEHGVHNAVQVAIGGDIMFNTAPYDPLFYLHHSQLDRLWWRWQHLHPSHQMEYLGLANNISDTQASLEDIISMGDFAPGVAVKDLMRTDSGILCYRY